MPLPPLPAEVLPDVIQVGDGSIPLPLLLDLIERPERSLAGAQLARRLPARRGTDNVSEGRREKLLSVTCAATNAGGQRSGPVSQVAREHDASAPLAGTRPSRPCRHRLPELPRPFRTSRMESQPCEICARPVHWQFDHSPGPARIFTCGDETCRAQDEPPPCEAAARFGAWLNANLSRLRCNLHAQAFRRPLLLEYLPPDTPIGVGDTRRLILDPERTEPHEGNRINDGESLFGRKVRPYHAAASCDRRERLSFCRSEFRPGC